MKTEKDKVVNLNPKKISTAINNAVNKGFEVDTSDDQKFLQGLDCSWDDLNALRETVANSLMEFVHQVKQLAENQSILATLGPLLDEFTSTVKIFFNDVTQFSEKVRVIREKHEHLSGAIKDMNEFDTYNRLTMEYHGMCSELTILLQPTMAQLILLSSEAIDKEASKEKKLVIDGKGEVNEQ